MIISVMRDRRFLLSNNMEIFAHSSLLVKDPIAEITPHHI